MRKFSDSKRAKITAIAAVGLVLGVGGTATLAAWVDTEWVFGGSGATSPGVGTSTFVVEQNRTSPFAQLDGSWQNHPDNPGGILVFGGDAPLALTPGDTIFAPVALRTTSTSVAGTVDAQEAVAATGISPAAVDPDGLLWDALELTVGRALVASAGPAPTCDASLTGYTTIADGVGLDTPYTDPSEPIAAAGATFHHYCFVISLPEADELQDWLDTYNEENDTDFEVSDFQGRTLAPAWEFISTSN